MLIKNCGLRTASAVDTAIASGAQFLGFVFHPASPRHLQINEAAMLCRTLPAHVKRVAVMVNPTDDALRTLLSQWRPDYVQLHGDESPQRVQAVREHSGLHIIKALGVATTADVTRANDYVSVADMLLFDTKHLDLPGGSGQSFDWSLLAGLSLPLPWFLSGGLHVGNVAEALRITGARAVDVSSGIEAARGVKDAQKIIAFNHTALRCAP